MHDGKTATGMFDLISRERASWCAVGMACFLAMFLFAATSEQVPAQETVSEIIEGITMIGIPAGSFEMGGRSAWAEWTEKPVHTVTLDAFYLSETQVTQAQYQSVTGENPSHFRYDDALPVESVSWYDAVRFCNLLSDRAGIDRCYDEETWECDFNNNGFRLPTEAEWEYACRAGTTTMYWSGDTYRDLARAGWYQAVSGAKTHLVGTKSPNPWGLYDMHGNIWEWCNDWWMENYYDITPENNPHGPGYSFARIARGGRFYSSARHSRAAIRGGISPDYTGSGYGFRLARNRKR